MSRADVIARGFVAQPITFLRAREFRPLIGICAASLLVRLLFLGLMAANGAVETGRDAQGYFDRAVGVELALRSLANGQLPSTADLARAYTSGWPPLQTLVLGVGLFLFGHSLLAGALVMVLLSTAITPLVYAVTASLSDRRSALFAAGLFALYPSFIQYSLRPFSETTFILILFLLLIVLLRLARADSVRSRIAFAALAGCLIGLGTLVRAITLAWIPAVALWAGWQVTGRKNRLLTAMVLVGMAVVTLLPWELTVYAHEGRVVAVTHAADISRYLRSHFRLEIPALVPRAPVPNAAPRIKDVTTIERQAGVQPMFDVPSPLRQLARTWNPDFTLYRYLFILGYPPLDSRLVGAFVLLTLLGFGMFVLLALWGLWLPSAALKHRLLILALIGAACLLHTASFGQSRYSIPLLALLLPAAGHGLAHVNAIFQRVNRQRAVFALACLAGLGALVYVGMPYEYGTLSPSSYYVPLVRTMDAALGQSTLVSDRLLLRAVGEPSSETLTIAPVSTDYQFVDETPGGLEWTPAEDQEVDLVFRSRTAVQPMVLTIGDANHSATVTLTPSAWHAWQPSGLPGIEYLWLGSGAYREADVESGTRRY